MIELKNCPFCGKRKTVNWFLEKFGQVIRCTYCGAMVSSHISVNDAAKLWNTRVECDERKD